MNQQRLADVNRRVQRAQVVGLACLLIAALAGLILLATAVDSRAYERSPKAGPEQWLPTNDGREVGSGGYWLSYDGRSRSARWTLEYLTPDGLARGVERAGAFRIDVDAPAECRASPKDYEGSGYDRGHLVPSADYRTSAALQAETFRLSNVAPQVAECNRGVWKMIESHARSIAENSTATVIVTAPLYLPDDTGTVIIATIGENQVWVPTHFGKAVLYQASGGEWIARAWIVPNADCGDMGPAEYLVTIDAFERAAGIDLWAALPDELERDLEAAEPVRPEAE